jgi:hypothetical protein
MSIENINEQMAHTCGCGSVNFNLRRSLDIECAGCGATFGLWRKLESDKVFAALQHSIDMIEKCGASPELTAAVSFTSGLMGAFGNRWNAPRDYAVKQFDEWEIPVR